MRYFTYWKKWNAKKHNQNREHKFIHRSPSPLYRDVVFFYYYYLLAFGWIILVKTVDQKHTSFTSGMLTSSWRLSVESRLRLGCCAEKSECGVCGSHSVGIYYRSKRQPLQPNIVEIIAFFEQKKNLCNGGFCGAAMGFTATTWRREWGLNFAFRPVCWLEVNGAAKPNPVVHFSTRSTEI